MTPPFRKLFGASLEVATRELRVHDHDDRLEDRARPDQDGQGTVPRNMS
jgi:hypothetical protein